MFVTIGDEHQINYLKARKVSELPACLEQDFENLPVTLGLGISSSGPRH